LSKRYAFKPPQAKRTIQKEVQNLVKLAERLHEADWKAEKHLPVIECPDQVKTG
jgi:desulfoferrodoxin (superoxide reductase-like protein)